MHHSYDPILRLLVAALLGSVIGLERERLNWMAGLRTHMLVCVGSALAMLVSAYGFAEALRAPDVVLDPSRVAAQVVSGIGFLGAGVILLRGDVLRGVNTAASLWSVAGVGLAVGGGMYVAAVGATGIILLILAGIKPIERRLSHAAEKRAAEARGAQAPDLELLAEHDALGAGVICEAWRGETARLTGLVLTPGEHRLGSEGLDTLDHVGLRFEHASAPALQRIELRLLALPGVRACWRGAAGSAPR